MHTLLPRNAQLLLQRAASTPNTDQDPKARQKAIEAATAKIKLNHPECFVEEHDDAENTGGTE